MKLLTFLGVGPYGETEYFWKDKSCLTCYAPVASCAFLQPSQLIVFTTEKAKEAHGSLLAEKISIPLEFISVPDGKDENELWKVFSQVTNSVKTEEEVAFDVTHGLRSFPLVGLLVAAYLRASLDVELKAVLYGAYDVRDQSVVPARTPMFDLTPMISLLKWASATDQFVQTGNANRLGELLNPTKSQSGVLYEASNTLRTISQAAAMCQPFTLMQEVPKLEITLQEAENELNAAVPPFGALREKIVTAYSQFQDDGKDIFKQLQTEFRLVEWYYGKGQLIQTATLAREWLIDAITYRLGEKIDFALDYRKPFEEAISGVALIGKPHPQERDRLFTENDLNRFGLQVQTWKNAETLKQLWTDLKNVRNPLDHAEHQRKREQEKSLIALNKLQTKMNEKVMPSLRQVAREWNLS